GLFRRAALLVAEDHGTALSGLLGKSRSNPDLLRLQHDLLSAIHPGRARNAAPLSHLRSVVASLERALVSRRLDARTRLCVAPVLSRLVAVLGAQGGARPMECNRA